MNAAVIVTGTWGVGKTTILDRLSADFTVVGEPARIALAEDPSVGDDTGRFTCALLERPLADYESIGPGVTLFDRGVPDYFAYSRWFELETSGYEAAAQRFRYHEDVMFCPAWDEIYTTDDLRKATFEMAAAFEATLTAAYGGLRYHLVPVPFGPVDERVELVRPFVAELV